MTLITFWKFLITVQRIFERYSNQDQPLCRAIHNNYREQPIYKIIRSQGQWGGFQTKIFTAAVETSDSR